MDAEPAPPPLADPDASRRASLAALTIFLDNHDASCPECGYSLRGIQSEHCPECGWAISLRPGDGVDRRRVLRMAKWIAWIGVIVSATEVAQLVAMILSVGFGFGFPGMFGIFYLGHVALLVVSVSALIRIRRLRAAPTRAVLKTTGRFSLTILIIILVTEIVPFLLGVLMMLLDGWMF